MDLGVRDQGYLIVGGTAGIGLAAAAVLAADGARVAIAGRDGDRAKHAAAQIEAESGQVPVVLLGDIGRPDDAERLVAEGADALGDLAGVAVTAGGGRAAHSTLETATEEVWREAFDSMLMGTVRTVRAALPRLVERGSGTVVTTAAYSIHAYHPARVPYLAMKTAIAAFTKTVAKSHGPHGVRANCVCPGAIETDGLAAMRRQIAADKGVPPEEALERYMGEMFHMDIALGRPGRPREVGELFALLLSPCAGYLNGAVINIDGGTDF
jgi:NAD(P)-dependent dehydrogenase (short-subunit alcohol dehydrogenase family)